MALVDRQYLPTPFYGSRRMTAWRQTLGHRVNRKQVQRLIRLMGIEAIYQSPRTCRPSPEHRIYPYLLRGLAAQSGVGCRHLLHSDGPRVLYLVAVMDWVSRFPVGY
jgi:putative transposase